MNWTKPEITILKGEILLALKTLETKHGVEFQIGAISWNPRNKSASMKMEVAESFEEKQIADIDNSSMRRGLSLRSIHAGTPFSYQGRTFEFKGVNHKAAKYPILAEETGTGKTFCMPRTAETTILQAYAQLQTNPQTPTVVPQRPPVEEINAMEEFECTAR